MAGPEWNLLLDRVDKTIAIPRAIHPGYTKGGYLSLIRFYFITQEGHFDSGLLGCSHSELFSQLSEALFAVRKAPDLITENRMPELSSGL